MHAVRIVLFALCCAAPAAAQEMPGAELMREVELRRALHLAAFDPRASSFGDSLAGHDHHARVWLHKPARETS